MKITNNFKIPQFKTSFKSSNEKQNNKENSSNIIQFSKNSSNAIKNNALSLIITGKVSAYAKTNPIEFIAEYVAGRMNGYDYPTEVKECIQKFTPLDLKFPSESQQ